MKTSVEILAKIEATRKEERKQLVEWAIKLIDNATEKMFEYEHTSHPLCTRQDSSKFYEALQLEEVQQALEGFKVKRPDRSFGYNLYIAE